MKPILGVNIDHIATLRQQRGETYPDPTYGAKIAIEAGAEQITFHLREDRRHIQDADAYQLKEAVSSLGAKLNFELGCNENILKIAADVKPDWVCLVPEKREEKTTEGGLDLVDEINFTRVQKSIEFIREKTPKTKISLFLESDLNILEKALKLQVDAVEIHTGDYALNFENETSNAIQSFQESINFLNSVNIRPHAGHGLTYENSKPLLKMKGFVEYNIGHWIICEAVFLGLSQVVSKYNNLLKEYTLS